MWDERYESDEYAYGTEPNDFLAKNYHDIPKGKVLNLAEGEGRNAVFLAKKGYSVTAVDASKVGLKKAENLAKENNVEIELIHADLTEFDIKENTWDGIISIFCPLPQAIRRNVHQRAVMGLKLDGVFLLEAYTPEQIKYKTGGGNAIDVMTTKDSILSDLEGMHFIHVEELEREVIEGQYHTGLGAVLQTIAKKV